MLGKRVCGLWWLCEPPAYLFCFSCQWQETVTCPRAPTVDVTCLAMAALQGAAGKASCNDSHLAQGEWRSQRGQPGLTRISPKVNGTAREGSLG
ncbi:hypothetical protein GCM10027217_41300 [Pseudomaricurvus hydrocarbonicus]